MLVSRMKAFARPKIIQVAFLISLVILSSIFIYSFLRNRDIIKNSLKEQIKERNLVLAKSAGKSIEEFIFGQQNQLLLLNAIEEIASLDEVKTRQIFNNQLKLFKDTPLFALARVDNKGQIVVLASRDKFFLGEGQSVVETDFYQWAKKPENKGKIYMTNPIVSQGEATKGQMVIGIVTPSYFQGKFNGFTATYLLMDKFFEIYIDPIKFNDEGRTLLVDQNGVLISGRNKSLINKSLFEYAQNTRWKGWEGYVATLQEALKQNEGKMAWVFKPTDQNLQNRIGGFVKIKVADKQWWLFVTNRNNLFYKFLPSTYSLGVLALIIFVVTTLILGILFILIHYVVHKEGFLKGYKHALEDIKRD